MSIDKKFKGIIKLDVRDFKPDWAPQASATRWRSPSSQEQGSCGRW